MANINNMNINVKCMHTFLIWQVADNFIILEEVFYGVITASAQQTPNGSPLTVSVQSLITIVRVNNTLE